MVAMRFGDILGRLANLSRHDVNEILEDQSGSHRRFGEIALSMGMCQPEHVWQAWCDQLLTQVQKVDIDQLGVDAQAAGMIHHDVARRLGAIAIRCMGEQLIVAVSNNETQNASAELSLMTGKQLRFVIADPHQIQRAIATYYAAGPAAA